MTTSIVVYLPTGPRKAVLAAIADFEYQLAMRVLRKNAELPVAVQWRNCRRDPGVWELKVTSLTLLAPIRWVSLEELRADETLDQNILNKMCG